MNCRRSHVVIVQQAVLMRVRRHVRVESLPLRNLESRRELLLPLGPAVLEPGFYLNFGEAEAFREFESLADAQIFVLLKLALELLELDL